MKPIKFILAIALGSFGVATHASADTFKIDPVHSSILFSATHLGVSNLYGRFNDVSGTVTFDQADPSKSSGPDFFNGKQFPVMTFKSTKVEGSGDAYKVTGDFTLHGVTKPLTFEVKKGGEGKGEKGEIRGGGEARFTIKRSDYGMTFMQGPVGDEINVIVSLEGVKE